MTSRKPPDRSSLGKLGGSALLPTLAAVFVFANTWNADFVLDDLEIVRDNPLLGQDLGQLWLLDYWSHVRYGDHALYRPFTMTTYALQTRLQGDAASHFHVANTILHGLATWALFGLTRRLFGTRISWAAALLFAVHPIHTEAVAGIVGRAEILALLGSLGSALAYCRARESSKQASTVLWVVSSVMCMGIACFSKETGVLAPLWILGIEIAFPKDRWILRGGPEGVALVLGTTAMLIAFFVLRAGVIEGHSVSQAWAGISEPLRVASALRVFAENVGLLLVPLQLSADYGANNVRIAEGFLEPAVLVGLGLLVGIFALVSRIRTLPAVGLGAAWFLLTLLPVSNIFFPIGVIKAERLLYTPSAGFLILVAAGLSLAQRRVPIKSAFTSFVVVLALTYGARTWVRNLDWKDPCTLAAATLETSPGAPIFATTHARCLALSGDVPGARAAYHATLELHPEYPTALLGAGILEREQGELKAAVGYLERLLAQRPAHEGGFSNLTYAYYELGRYPEAIRSYRQWIEVNPRSADAHAGLLAALIQADEIEEASRVASDAQQKFPNDPRIKNNATMLSRYLQMRSP